MTTYIFNIEGLQIGSYSFCPKATCELLQSQGLIEDFTFDRNNEPVILFTKDCEDGNGNWQATTGFELWCNFVKSFPMNETLAGLIWATVQNRQDMETIDSLLNLAA